MTQITLDQFKDAFFRLHDFFLGEGTPLSIAPLTVGVLHAYPYIEENSLDHERRKIVIDLDSSKISEDLAPSAYKQWLAGIKYIKQYMSEVGISLLWSDSSGNSEDRRKIYTAVIPYTEESLQKLERAFKLAQAAFSQELGALRHLRLDEARILESGNHRPAHRQKCRLGGRNRGLFRLAFELK